MRIAGDCWLDAGYKLAKVGVRNVRGMYALCHFLDELLNQQMNDNLLTES